MLERHAAQAGSTWVWTALGIVVGAAIVTGTLLATIGDDTDRATAGGPEATAPVSIDEKLDKADDAERTGTDSEPTGSEPSASEASGAAAGSTAEGGAADADELCALHAQHSAIVVPIGTVEDAVERRAVIKSLVAFYGAAAGLVSRSEAAAFAAVRDYYEAIRLHHEANGWDAELDLAIALQLPRPATGTLDVVHGVLESRCGVTILSDTSG